MKNLIYKELKLAFHPIIWLFVFLFPLLSLIPEYPTYICFIYLCSCYPILFLGANKGQSSNDIFYSCLLPIRKKDIVKARLLSVSLIFFITSLILLLLSPIKLHLYQVATPTFGEEIEEIEGMIEYVGMDAESIFSLIAVSLLAFTLYDYIYFNLFYRSGRNIVGPTLVSTFIFIAIFMSLATVLPCTNRWYYYNICVCSYSRQLLYLLICLIIYIIGHYLTYKSSSKLIEKIDF